MNNASLNCIITMFLRLFADVFQLQFVAPVDAQLGALAHAALNCGNEILNRHLVSAHLRGDRILASEYQLSATKEGPPSESDAQPLVPRERVEQVIYLGGVWVRKFKPLKKRALVGQACGELQVRVQVSESLFDLVSMRSTKLGTSARCDPQEP